MQSCPQSTPAQSRSFLQFQIPLGSLQSQQTDVKSAIKADLLDALAHVPHTGVYGLEVDFPALTQY